MSKKDGKFKGVSDNYLSRHINRKIGRVSRPSLKMIGDWRKSEPMKASPSTKSENKEEKKSIIIIAVVVFIIIIAHENGR